VERSGSGVWGGGRDADAVLIERLSTLAGVLDPVPAGVLAGARDAFAGRGARAAGPAADWPEAD
jgi:hypothetical protein